MCMLPTKTARNLGRFSLAWLHRVFRQWFPSVHHRSLSAFPSALPAATLHAATGGRSRQLPTGRSCTRRGFCVRAMRLARGGGLPPRRWIARSMRSKGAPKTGDHGGRIRQSERDRFIPKASAIQHVLGEGHRALRAPASASVSSAGSQAPGVKSGGGSLLLSRHWLPQLPALRAAAYAQDAGSTGGLVHDV